MNSNRDIFAAAYQRLALVIDAERRRQEQAAAIAALEAAAAKAVRS